MADMDGFLKIVKKAAVDAVNAEKPVAVCFGRVVGTSPLKISVEQKMALGAAQLILTNTVKENALFAGDSVCLLRMQGGQKYVVVDKL